jgi:glycine/D-amino acid oxidase-like deaminating enzyme/nitrite reductase/ring-hydroxylating ferredoxin subunit
MTSKKHQSYWLKVLENQPYAALNQDLQTEILVVGAGIAGLLTAYHLAKAGKKVVVLDRNGISYGNTGFTTAHLTWLLDSSYPDVLKIHGNDKTRQALESHRWAIRFIEDTAHELKLDCDFRRLDGRLFLKPGDKPKVLEEQLEALETLGVQDARISEASEPHTYYEGPALVLPRQARFHPGKYLLGIAQAIQSYGGKIYTESPAVKIGRNEVTLENSCRIEAEKVVVATHSPIHTTLFPAKEAPYRTYAIGAKIPKGALTDCLYWDTDEPYHYVRIAELDSVSDLLIAGGEDHKTGQSDSENDCYERLISWTQERYPFVQEITHSWSGQILETIDRLAYIGKFPKDQETYIASGFFGNGMTYGAVAGKLLSDEILGHENEWAKLYDPSRASLKGLPEFVSQNLNVAKVFTQDWAAHKDPESLQELPAGEGTVVTQDGKKIACFKDEQGKIHSYSAVCPHLNCIVRWNDGEKTFDCPCHGSRFSSLGEVLEGPAAKGLPPVELKHETPRAA